jgi:hypothetical protein
MVLRVTAICVAAWMMVAGTPPARAEVFDQYQVKAVFLFNLTNFITWPDNSDPNPPTTFTIGILGPDPFGEALEKAVKGEKKYGRAITIRQFANLDELNQQACDLLFINGELSTLWPQIRSIVKERGILTVSDVKGFCDRGGMVNLLASARKISIEINRVAAKRNGFEISAKLLKVARIVTGGKEN